MTTETKQAAKVTPAADSLYARASKYMKGGACAPGRIHGSIGRPLYLKRASGARLYDVDGNEYIDFNASLILNSANNLLISFFDSVNRLSNHSTAK